MIYEYIIVGCGVSGIMAATMIKKETDNFIIIEQEADLGGIWRYYAKNETHLQHNSSMYLLDSFFNLPDSHISKYASKNEILAILKKFTEDTKIRFNTKVIGFTECNNIISVTIKTNSKEKIIKCKYLFICTGNLAATKTATLPQLKLFQYKLINYVDVDYDSYFKNIKHVVVIGPGASGVEVCLNAIKHDVAVTLVYNNHLGFYFNNYFTEFLFTLIHFLPRNIATYIYISIQKLIAKFYGYELPPFIGTERLYPFSTAFIKAYNEQKIKIIKNDQLNKTIMSQADGIIETVGFDNSLKQFCINNTELYNLNTQHPKYNNVFFIGLNKSNTGTTPYSNYIIIAAILYMIGHNLQNRKIDMSAIDDTIYTPLLYLYFLFKSGVGIWPFIDIIKLWLYSLFYNVT